MTVDNESKPILNLCSPSFCGCCVPGVCKDSLHSMAEMERAPVCHALSVCQEFLAGSRLLCHPCATDQSQHREPWSDPDRHSPLVHYGSSAAGEVAGAMPQVQKHHPEIHLFLAKKEHLSNNTSTPRDKLSLSPAQHIPSFTPIDRCFYLVTFCPFQPDSRG